MNTTTRLEDMPVFAACALVPSEDGKILVVHDFRRGTGIPAGSVEPGESPLTCALRELEEETGIEATAYYGDPLYDALSDFGVRVQTFLVRAWKGEPRSSIEGDVYWADRKELINACAAYPIYNGALLKHFDEFFSHLTYGDNAFSISKTLINIMLKK